MPSTAMGILRAIFLTLAVSAVPAAQAFASAPHPRIHSSPKTSTSTTLYYRDDVPPIGSAPKWETPNDFDQFLTQCTIQSFTFLLKSLRDDHTIRWLDNFTQPVFEKASDSGKDKDATPKEAKPKISLAEAAQSALLQTEQALDDSTVETPPVAPVLEEEEGVLPEEPPLIVEEVLPMVGEIHDAAESDIDMDAEMFTSSEELLDDVPEPPVSNTGIDNLYTSSGLPKKQNNPPIVRKSNFSPFGAKPKAVPPTPFGRYQQPPGAAAGTSIPGSNIPSNSNSNNKYTGGFMPTPNTSPLYGGGGDAASANEDPAAKSTSKPNKATTSQQPNKIGSVLKYHGLGILNNTKFPTWDAYFEQLLDQPKELLLVESFNPNLPDIELDIDPASLCRRMISVRTQIAQEFEHDLQVIADMGGLTLKSYNKMIEETREQEAEEKLQQQKDALENLMPKSMEDSITNNNGAKSSEGPKPAKPQVQRANLLFLERGVGEGDAANCAPSPLRKGNFDLLCLLATQEAIHRVLNDPTRQARKSPEHGSKQFLQDFYVKRLLSHFSGDQRYGRSDDFVEELLACPPRMITVGNTNDDKPADDGHEDSLTKDLTYLVDPVLVAQTILNEREVVALQWKEHLAEQSKADHRNIQNMILAKVMDGTVEECETVDTEGNDIKDDFESCFE